MAERLLPEAGSKSSPIESVTDRKFHRLLLAMLAALVTVPSTAEDRLAACALAGFTFRKAGAAGGHGFEGRTVTWGLGVLLLPAGKTRAAPKRARRGLQVAGT